MEPRTMDDWKTYVCTYRFEGSEYGFEVPARSEAEARERIKSMSLGRVDGELGARIPAVAGGGFLAPLIVWFRNAFKI